MGTRNDVNWTRNAFVGKRLVPIRKYPKPQSNPQRRHPELDSGSNQSVDIVYKPWLLTPKHSCQFNWKQRLKPLTGRFRVGARNDVGGSVGKRLVPIRKYPKPQSNPQRRHPELDSGSNHRVGTIYKPRLLTPKHSYQLNWKQRLKPLTGRFRVGARNDVGGERLSVL